MSKKLTAEEKAANKAKKAAGGLGAIAGKPHTVEFDHSYEDSEPIMAPNPKKPSQMLYTGHDKQITTIKRSTITYPNLQLAEAFKANHQMYPEHGIRNVKIRQGDK